MDQVQQQLEDVAQPVGGPEEWVQEELDRALCTEVELNQVQILAALQTDCVNLSKLNLSASGFLSARRGHTSDLW